jgi:hypothetical protein
MLLKSWFNIQEECFQRDDAEEKYKVFVITGGTQEPVVEVLFYCISLWKKVSKKSCVFVVGIRVVSNVVFLG